MTGGRIGVEKRRERTKSSRETNSVRSLAMHTVADLYFDRRRNRKVSCGSCGHIANGTVGVGVVGVVGVGVMKKRRRGWRRKIDIERLRLWKNRQGRSSLSRRRLLTFILPLLPIVSPVNSTRCGVVRCLRVTLSSRRRGRTAEVAEEVHLTSLAWF